MSFNGNKWAFNSENLVEKKPYKFRTKNLVEKTIHFRTKSFGSKNTYILEHFQNQKSGRKKPYILERKVLVLKIHTFQTEKVLVVKIHTFQTEKVLVVKIHTFLYEKNMVQNWVSFFGRKFCLFVIFIPNKFNSENMVEKQHLHQQYQQYISSVHYFVIFIPKKNNSENVVEKQHTK